MSKKENKYLVEPATTEKAIGYADRSGLLYPDEIEQLKLQTEALYNPTKLLSPDWYRKVWATSKAYADSDLRERTLPARIRKAFGKNPSGPSKIEEIVMPPKKLAPKISEKIQGKIGQMKKMPMRVAKAPVSRAVMLPKSVYRYNGGSGLRIQHREYVGDVVSSGTTFNATSFCIMNPGDPASFPWLSSIAASFQKYRYRSAKFVYVPTCATTTAGVVVLGFDTNAQRATPSTKTAIIEYACSARSAPWMESSLYCTGIDRTCYTVFGNNYGQSGVLGSLSLSGTSVDTKSYAAGVLFVGCDGISASTVGEIYLEYDIELLDPGVMRQPLVQIHAQTSTAGATAPFTGMTTISNELCSLTSGNIFNILDCPTGTYLVLVRSANTGTQSAPTITASGTSVSNGTGSWSSTTTTINWSFFTVDASCTVVLTATNFSNLTGVVHMVILPYDSGLTGFT